MLAATTERPSPADVCDHTSETDHLHVGTIVRVSTHNAGRWPRDQFVAWLNNAMEKAGIKNDYELAQLAKIDHSSISSWRSGRQWPSPAKLTAIATVLNRPAKEAWVKAGRLAPADEEDDHIRAIRESSLSKAQQDMLIAMYREDMQRAGERVRQQIELLSNE